MGQGEVLGEALGDLLDEVLGKLMGELERAAISGLVVNHKMLKVSDLAEFKSVI